jgi:tripeptidyl-peptidase-1
MLKTLFLIALAFAGCFASWENYWQKGARASADHEHSVIIGIALNNDAAEACPTLLDAVSNPNSPMYGQHLSFDEMKMFTNMTNFKIVRQWLERSGVSADRVKPTPNFEFIRLSSTIGELESLFGAEFYMFTSTEDSNIAIPRTKSLVLPAAVRHSIDLVSNTRAFPAPPSALKPWLNRVDGKRQSGGNVSPSLLSRFYGINNTQASTKASQSLFEALSQSFTPSDLTAFQQNFNLPQYAVSKVIGPNSPSECSSNPNNCAEANLDVQWILSVAQKTTTWYWSIPGSGDIFTEWSAAVAGNSDAPYVHSISYGSIATEDPQTDMERFNTEICKFGLRGLTVCVATGDDGVANFQARGNPSECGFTPSFPATSPYVTAVGATQGPEAGQPEVACTSATGGLITSGGGFSDFFKRPDYQETAVTAYLKNGPNLPPFKQFNRNGRAYPDVAMMGHNYPIYIGGNQYVGSGTSASTPVFAGVVSLINGLRFAQGKGSVGFINPILYKNGGSNVFNDITSGENNCCAGQPGSATCCQYGFNATTGWDPVTGWGSVNFANLAKVLVEA